MDIKSFADKYNLEPITEVEKLMPSGYWGEVKLDEVVSVDDKDWLIQNFCKSSLGAFKSLKSLDLTDCVSDLPADDFFHSSSLEELTKVGGKIKLNRGVGRLINLKSIKFSAVHVTSLPKTIGKLGMLETLILADTKIKKLPDTFHELGGLRTLEIWPKLCELPDILPASLEDVDLRSNKLSSLSEALMGLTGLQSLDVSSNPLVEVCVPDNPNKTLKVLNLARSPFGILHGHVEGLRQAFPAAKIVGGDGGKFIENGKTIYLSCTKQYYSQAHPGGTESYH